MGILKYTQDEDGNYILKVTSEEFDQYEKTLEKYITEDLNIHIQQYCKDEKGEFYTIRISEEYFKILEDANNLSAINGD